MRRPALRSVGAVLLALAGACIPTGREEVPRLGPLPEFSLRDQRGQPVTLAGLKGRIWVADFIFTRCGGACPAMTARMAVKLAAMEIPPSEQKPGEGDGPFLHSSKFVLVDRLGGIRGYYDRTDEDDVKKLRVDIGRLQDEKRS